jgi:hypothetical protein
MQSCEDIAHYEFLFVNVIVLSLIPFTLMNFTATLCFIAFAKQQFEFVATANAAAVTSCACKLTGSGGGLLPL